MRDDTARPRTITAIATIILLATPVSVTGPAGGFVRVNNACGQATECTPTAIPYIYSTIHGDHRNDKCSRGCDK
jgi:hypothetical protein